MNGDQNVRLSHATAPVAERGKRPPSPAEARKKTSNSDLGR